MLKQKIPYIYLAIPFLIVIVLTGLNYPKIKDEPFHHTAITQFPQIYSRPGPLTNQVRVVPLPGYFAIQFLFGKIIGFEPWKLRLVNVIFGWLALVVFFKTLTQFKWLKINKKAALFVSLLLFLNPYFFGTSFLIYTDMPALCFALLGMYFYLQKKNLPSAAFFMLAVFTRQSYVFLPAAIILQNIIYKKAKIFTPRILIYIIPFIGLSVAAAVLASNRWLLWQHFPYKRYSFLSLYPLNELMISMGIYALPLIMVNPKRLFKKTNLIASLLFLPMLFAIPLSHRNPFYTGAGIFTNGIIGLSEKMPFFGLRYILLFFWFLGALAIVEAIRNTWRDKNFAFFHFQLITCGIMFLAVNFFWEKYIMMILPAIFILLAHNMKLPNKTIAYSIAAFLYIINIAGFYLSVMR